MSKKIRVDDEIAYEIERVSEVLHINNVQASRLIFLGSFKRWGRPKKPWYDKTMAEAQVSYRRRRIAKNVINVL